MPKNAFQSPVTQRLGRDLADPSAVVGPLIQPSFCNAARTAPLPATQPNIPP